MKLQKVEGASRWQTFVKITIPLLMPIIFFLMLTGFINTFQAFNSIFVMQTSSAGDTLWMLLLLKFLITFGEG